MTLYPSIRQHVSAEIKDMLLTTVLSIIKPMNLIYLNLSQLSQKCLK